MTAVAAMGVVLFALLFVWANHSDGASRLYEERLVAAATHTAFRQIELATATRVTWDEAVRHLDNQFDPIWAEAYLGADAQAAMHASLAYVVDADDKIVFASQNGHRRTAQQFADIVQASRPLLATVRQAETQRGPFIGASKSGGTIAYPIQFSSAEMLNGAPYSFTASLVQPSFGAALPKGARAPVVFIGRPLNQNWLQRLSERYLLSDLKLIAGSAPRQPHAARYVLLNGAKEPVATLEWSPARPGTGFLYKAIAPVSLVVLILAAGLYLVLGKSQAVARRLAHSEARLKLALSTAKAGAFEIDQVSQTFWCSPEMVEIVGRRMSYVEAIQAPWPFIHSDDTDMMADPSLGQAGDGVRRRAFEVRIVRPDGHIRWILLSFNADGDRGLGSSRVTGLVQDIDQRKRQELALVEAERAAQSAAEAKSRFLATISHEIRTPMNGVLGVLHLLKQQQLSGDGLQLLNEALACGQMLTGLIDDVLDFSKIEADEMDLSPAPIDPVAALEGVAKLLRPQCDIKGVRLDVTAAGDIGWVLMDPIRLRQALFNLIGNSVKFTSVGGVHVRLTRPEAGLLRFEVADTGLGIPEAAQDGLFEHFRQGDSSTTRKFGGTGLGLAITRQLARLMGGDVGFHSTAGVGSTFWLELSAPPTAMPVAAVESAAPMQHLRVLVVEDNPTNRLIATRLLESMGMSVETADDGEQGVAAATRGGFDLILMDVQMPGMDGLEATRHIRAMGGRCAATPIIALTANAMTHQREAYFAAGMDGVVAKPFSPSALVVEIARLTSARPHERSEALAS